MRTALLTLAALALSGALTGLVPPPVSGLAGALGPGLAYASSAGKHASRNRHRPDSVPVLFPQAALEPVRFADLPGWSSDDVATVLAAFRRSCAMNAAKGDLVTPPRPFFTALAPICARVRHLPRHVSEHRARAFLEREFRPYAIAPIGQPDGFLTGYYEPEVEGSRTRTAEFHTPLYRRPPDLVTEPPPKGSPPSNRAPAYRRVDGKLVPYFDRAAIDDGALKDKGLEIAWVRDPADAFFAQIQGSIRIRLPDGGVLRLNYDGHNGQPYTPIGRLLIERGLVPREKMSMDAIRAYIGAHPEEGQALMRENRSFIFFREAHELKADDGAVGAQGLPLVAGRSIAVDKRIHAYGTLFYIAAALPTGTDGALQPFDRLMVAQDTGSAIVGPARADIFFGAGDVAGSISGRIQHPGRFVILLPRALDPARHRVPRPPKPPVRSEAVSEVP
ncbi:murein transglycosylase A [Ancylobacter mangrovi]|uniref:murein transglycosylase A n=1 Tax=Ancylobacter mangrovi TaxID=2972472 RepID=UPI0021623A6B|nr:MltA domain-containing protein [Ancylobacter mangrovi]MCS0502516.1 MltA domain-containing protein [Ancylobacter mangrovi]